MEEGINIRANIDTEGLERDVREATRLLKGIGQSTRREAEKTTQAIATMGKALGGLFSVKMAKDFAGEVVRVRGEVQQLEIAFRTMLGSQEKAEKLMQQLVDTAAKTPFDLLGVADSAKFLLGIRVPVEEVNDTLKMLGDIAAGVSAPLKDIAYLYGTTITKAHMDTMDLRQFTGRGIDLIGELSKQYGIATEQVQQYVAAGKVGAEDFKRAIRSIRETTFNNLMEEQAKSLTGQISNLQDAIDMMMNDIGTKTEGVASSVISTAASLVENYEKVGDAVYALVTAYGMYKGAQLSVIASERVAILMKHRHKLAAIALRKAQSGLSKSMLTNPYAIAGALLVGLTVSLIRYATRADAAAKAAKDFAKAQEEISERAEEQRSKAEQLVTTIRDANETNLARRTAYEQLITLYPDLLSKIDLEKLKTMELVDVLKLLNDERDKSVLKEKVLAVKVAEEELRRQEGHFKNTHAPATGYTPGMGGSAAGALVELFNWGGSSDKVDAAREKLRLAREDLEKTKKLLKEATGEETTTTGPKGQTLTEEELKKRAEEARKRAKAIRDYWEQVREEEAKGELSLREERVARMRDGVERELAENALEHDKRVARIGAQVTEWVNAYKQAYGVENATIESLSETQREMILALYDASEETLADANEKTLRRALEGVLTYSQQIERVRRQYAERRQGLREAGASDGNIEELDRQEADAIKALNAQFAEREESFKVFTRRIAKWGLEQLEEELKKAKAVLEGLRGKAGISDRDIAVASAEVDALEERIREKAVETAVEGADGAKRASEDWQKLYETLRRVQGQFDEIGDAIGGVEGEILKTAGAVASNVLTIINSITQLADLSIKGIEETAKGASKAVQMAERATVVLAIIGAVMQAVQKIANLVRTLTDDKEEREARAFRLEVQALNGALEETKAKAERAKAALQIFKGDDYGKAVADMASAEGAMKRLRKVEEEIVDENERLRDRFRGSIFWLELADTSGLDKLSQKVGAVVGNIDVETKKAKSALFGLLTWGGETKKLRDLVPELFNADKSINMDALDKFIGSDVYGKLSDKTKKALTDLKQAGQDYKESMRGVQEYLSDVFGQMGSDIMNNIVDAFRRGEDASKSFADSVNATLERMVQNMIFSSVFSDLLKDAEKELGDMFAQGSPESAYIDYFEGLMKDLEERGRLVEKRLKNVKDASGGKLFAPKDEDKKAPDGRGREASRRGIAQASQDTVDELNGRATAIQGHTYIISENSNLLVKNTSEMLLQVTGIRRNTDELQRLKSVEDNLRGVKFTLCEIQQKGLKIN